MQIRSWWWRSSTCTQPDASGHWSCSSSPSSALLPLSFVTAASRWCAPITYRPTLKRTGASWTNCRDVTLFSLSVSTPHSHKLYAGLFFFFLNHTFTRQLWARYFSPRTLPCELEAQGIKPPSLWLMVDLLSQRHHRPMFTLFRFFLFWIQVPWKVNLLYICHTKNLFCTTIFWCYTYFQTLHISNKKNVLFKCFFGDWMLTINECWFARWRIKSIQIQKLLSLVISVYKPKFHETFLFVLSISFEMFVT